MLMLLAVCIIRDLFEVLQYTRHSTVAAASRPLTKYLAPSARNPARIVSDRTFHVSNGERRSPQVRMLSQHAPHQFVHLRAMSAHGINSHVRHTSMRFPSDHRKATRFWFTPHSRHCCWQRFSAQNAPLYVLCVAPLSPIPAWRHAWQRTFWWC